jgi:hypothetical protein
LQLLFSSKIQFQEPILRFPRSDLKSSSSWELCKFQTWSR